MIIQKRIDAFAKHNVCSGRAGGQECPPHTVQAHVGRTILSHWGAGELSIKKFPGRSTTIERMKFVRAIFAAFFLWTAAFAQEPKSVTFPHTRPQPYRDRRLSSLTRWKHGASARPGRYGRNRDDGQPESGRDLRTHQVRCANVRNDASAGNPDRWHEDFSGENANSPRPRRSSQGRHGRRHESGDHTAAAILRNYDVVVDTPPGNSRLAHQVRSSFRAPRPRPE